MEKQKTIKTKIFFEGIGLHSGAAGKVSVLPAPADTGVVFRRIDVPESEEIKADVSNVAHGDLFRRCAIGKDKAKVNTLEHFMACCLAFGIDNLIVEINCEEFPLFDGSAKEIADKFANVGITELDKEKVFFQPDKPVAYKSGNIEISVMPSDKFIVTMWVEYANPHVGKQSFTIEISPESFLKEIAPARTFGFVEEIEPLRAAGLIKGGSLDNALIFGENGLVNNTELRFKDEIVRHKILDFIGDVALFGKPLKGHYTAVKSGHKSHIEFLKILCRH